MAIKIIPDDDIYVTQADFDKFQKQWNSAVEIFGENRSFEEFVRAKIDTDRFTADFVRNSMGARYKGQRVRFPKRIVK
jgi:hypothetical protein